MNRTQMCLKKREDVWYIRCQLILHFPTSSLSIAHGGLIATLPPDTRLRKMLYHIGRSTWEMCGGGVLSSADVVERSYVSVSSADVVGS